MPQLPSERAIAEFWEWFAEHRPRIEAAWLDDDGGPELAGLMDRAIASLDCKLGWELGPGTRRDKQLAFSLNQDLANLPAARAVVEHAPKLADWEFHAGRPAKGWHPSFEITVASSQAFEVDAEDWQYALIGFDNKSFFDVTIVAHNLTGVTDDIKQHAARILLDGMLGEVTYLERIGRVDVTDQDDLGDRLNKIRFIAAHLRQMTK